jgi:anti-sigma regulatory factor (Ser/Thr protein kinase)
LRFAATLDLLPQMLEVLKEELKKVEVSSKEKFQLEVSLEEALVNVIKYAYPTKSGEIELDCRFIDNQSFEIFIRDWGVPFDPNAMPKKDLNSLTIEERPIGGLGIYFINQLLDEVIYEREEGANVLVLKKRFNKEVNKI